jgi:hypothetical protein
MFTLDLASQMVSTSLEKIFQRRSSALQFVFLRLFGFLYAALGSVLRASVVRFNIVCGAVLHGLWCALI